MNRKVVCLAIVIIVLLVIGIFVGVSFLSKGEEKMPSGEKVMNEVVIKDKVFAYQNSSRDINLKIPEFQNLEENFERYINLKMLQDLSETTVYNQVTEGYAEDEIGFFTYEADYNRYDCGDYISIVENQYIHFGESRPQMKKKCYVIDTQKNASIALVDLFENRVDYKQSILNEMNRQAEEKGIELVGGNGLKEIKDNQAFYIKDNQLVIYFESSEIAATAVGELEFVMPFKMVDGKFTV